MRSVITGYRGTIPRLRTWSVLALAAVLLVGACAPATPAPTAGRAAGTEAAPPARGGHAEVQRPMVIALREEPSMLSQRMDRDGLDLPFTVTLAFTDKDEAARPMLAEKLPTQADGTWTVNADGSMRTVWTLKREAKWSDGQQITAADFVFTFQAYMDPEVPLTTRQPETLMSSVVARDERTIEINWRQPYIYANALTRSDLAPLPKHVLEETYLRDKAAFANSPYWTSEEFVGTGPYRVSKWDKGVAIFGVANPHFVMGKPKIEQIELRPVTDGNTIVAGFLAGSIDFSEYIAVTVEHAQILRERWQGSTDGTVYAGTMFGSRYMEFQHREVPNWQRAVTDVRVRRALAHAMDRESLAETMQLGFGPATETAIPKNLPIWQRVDAAIAKYPYDLRRADALFNEAGWTKGADGMYRNAGGLTLDMEVWATADRAQEPQIVASDWKKAGINSSVYVIPRAITTNPEARVSFPAAATSAHSSENDLLAAVNVTQNQAPKPENRWSGKNRGSYSNPEIDRLYTLARTTLDPKSRDDVIVDLERAFATEVAQITLYYVARPGASRKGLVGVAPPAFGSYLWNIWEWSLES